MPTDPDHVDVRATGSGVEVSVKVVPGAARTRVVGVLGGALKVSVTAPPEGGRANQAVIRLLAALLGVRPSDVQILRGRAQARKLVAIRGLTAGAAQERLP